MTPDNRKRRGINWGSAIGWLIFILVIAGGPIINLLRRILGGTIALPANTANLLPIVIGGLVVLSIIVSALRALGNANRTSTRLPSELSTPARPPSAPMPPFGGAARRPSAPPASPRAFTLPLSSTQQQRLPTPRFDPVINPLILAIGIVGLLVLGGAALLLFAQGGP
jgi:hypothetical protein